MHKIQIYVMESNNCQHDGVVVAGNQIQNRHYQDNPFAGYQASVSMQLQHVQVDAMYSIYMNMVRCFLQVKYNRVGLITV